MKVLLINMTSIGEVIHLFPALTDAVTQIQDLQFDWVIEQALQELPAWHNSISRVIPITSSQRSKTSIKDLTNTELFNSSDQLLNKKYNFIIDVQKISKYALNPGSSAVQSVNLTTATAGKKTAFTNVNSKSNLVICLRESFAKIFAYDFPMSMPDYGLKFEPIEIAKPFLIFLHSATWLSKHWPEVYWRELIQLAVAEGFIVYLPWNTDNEKQRSERITRAIVNTEVLPKMTLTELAKLMVNAAGAVTVDADLAHLTTALAIPTVALYGPTKPDITRMIGENQQHLQADFFCSPCFKSKCHYTGKAEQQPACFTTLKPTDVWQHLLRRLLS